MVTSERKPKLTYEDYAKTPDDERWELIDGELIIAPAPNMEHQSVQFEVGLLLGNFVKNGNLGRIFNAPTDVVLSDTVTVQPDLVFVSSEREHIITRANIQGAPDLVVEILSPSNAFRDWQDKFDLYARHGVGEYWVISPESKTISVFILSDGAFKEASIYDEDDTLISPTLEGFALELGEVFPERRIGTA